MTYGVRGYGSRAYGDSSLGGGAGLVGTGVDWPASITFNAAATFAAIPTRVKIGSITFNAAATVSLLARRTLTGRITFRAEASLVISPRPEGTEYRVVVTDVDGNRYAELENAELGSLTWVLNGIGTFDFSLDVMDPKAVHVLPIDREVQVWRGNILLWWGPITHVQATGKTLGVQCASFLWYFSRRYFGKADRDNLLQNGGFEDGLAHWNVIQDSGGFGITNPGVATPFPVDTVTDPTLVGERALVMDASPDGHTNHVSQTVSRTTDFVLGDLLTLVGWSFVPSSLYAGLNFNAEALGITVTNGVDYLTHQSTFFKPEAVDLWVRHEITLVQPVGTADLLADLGGVHGRTYWDEVRMVLMESLSTVGREDMTSWIVKEIIQYGQGRWVAFDHGKTDLNIDPNCPPSGVLLTRHYQMADHAGLLESMLEFTQIDGGCDIGEEFTPTRREIVTYYPEKGTYRRDIPLQYGANLTDFTWSFDGNVAANQVVIVGFGDGPDREEGGASTSSLFTTSLELVEPAPTGTGVERLDELAQERLRLVQVPVIIEAQTNPEMADEMVGFLRVGDRHPVWIDRGLIQVQADYRLVSIGLDPNDDTMSLTLNRA